MSLTAYLYDAEGRDREVRLNGRLPALEPQQLLWIDCEADGDGLAALASLLGLPPGLVVQLGTDGPAAALDNHGRFFRLRIATAPTASEVEIAQTPGRRASRAAVAALVRAGAQRVKAARLDLLVGETWIATVRDGDVPHLKAFRDQDKAETLIGALTPAALAGSLLDWHLEGYFAALSRTEALVDRLDEAALDSRRAERRHLAALALARRRVSQLRELLDAQRRVFYGLTRPDFALVAGTGAAPVYASLSARFDRLLDSVERARDLTAGSFDLLATRTGQDTNELVKVLTFVTVLEGVFAAVSGLFGMNFDTPWQNSGLTGFMSVLAGLVAFTAAAYVVARRRGWL